MNILFYRYGSICEPDIMDAFKALDLNIIEEKSEMYNKNITPIMGTNTVNSIFETNNFLFAFTVNFFPWLSDLCEIYKIPYICLIVDSPVFELYSNSISNSCNKIFIFDKVLYNEFYQKNPNGIFHIPLATNIERNDKVCHMASSSMRNKFKSDISFIGSLYSEKCPFNKVVLPDWERGYMQGLIEAQLNVYGYNFIEDVISDDIVDTFVKCTPDFYVFPPKYDNNYKAIVAQQYISVKVAEQERLRALKMLSDNYNVDIYTGSNTSFMPNIHNRGFAKSLDEMPIIFNQSKINLNITAKSIRSGLSLRVFDVLGCGGFLITNYQSELPEFFDIGNDLECYTSLEELKDKVGYYLKNDSERERIAQNGYQKVKALHSYKLRMAEIINIVFG